MPPTTVQSVKHWAHLLKRRLQPPGEVEGLFVFRGNLRPARHSPRRSCRVASADFRMSLTVTFISFGSHDVICDSHRQRSLNVSLQLVGCWVCPVARTCPHMVATDALPHQGRIPVNESEQHRPGGQMRLLQLVRVPAGRRYVSLKLCSCFPSCFNQKIAVLTQKGQTHLHSDEQQLTFTWPTCRCPQYPHHMFASLECGCQS